jgi:hypothetical protein
MMKIRSTFFKVIAALILVTLVFASLPAGQAQAAISVQQAWANIYAGAAFPGTYSYTVTPGSDRILVVAVSSTISNNGWEIITVTYGGQPMTLEVGDVSPPQTIRQFTYLFYLVDTPSVMNGTPQNLTVNITSNRATRYNFVYAAVYAGVDQSNPISDRSNFSGLRTQALPVGPFSPVLTIGSGDQAVEIINLTRTGTPARWISGWATGWSPVISNTASNLYTAYVATDVTAGTTDSRHTANNTCYRSMSAMVLHASGATPTPTSTATVTETPTFTVTFTPTQTPLCYPDAYEPDDTYSQAGIIPSDGTTQDHLNTPPADEDWVRFLAAAGHSYEIRTMLLNDIDQGDVAANDTLLYLYDTDGVTQLAFNDDVGNTTWYMGPYYYRESIITWTAPAGGWYYVRELQWGPTAGYTIRDCHAVRIWVQDLTPVTPTFTPTSTLTFTPTFTRTITPTFTLTHTPVPLSGFAYVHYSSLILNAPDFGLNAQTISGKVTGGGGPPYTVIVHITDPNSFERNFFQNVEFDGTFELTPAESGDTYLGCDIEGIWKAEYEITDALGGTAWSTAVYWAVNFPRVHGIP